MGAISHDLQRTTGIPLHWHDVGRGSVSIKSPKVDHINRFPLPLARTCPSAAIMSEPTPMTKVLIFGGKTGWIGGLMYDLIEKAGALLWIEHCITNAVCFFLRGGYVDETTSRTEHCLTEHAGEFLD